MAPTLEGGPPGKSIRVVVTVTTVPLVHRKWGELVLVRPIAV